MNRECVEREKIFVYSTSDKGLRYRVYKEFQKWILGHHINRWANEFSRQFSKEEIQRANKCSKECSKSVDFRETENKTTLDTEYEANPWLFQRPCWKDKGKAGFVFLPEGRLGKIWPGLWSGSERFKISVPGNLTFSPWRDWNYQSQGLAALSLCDHWPLVHGGGGSRSGNRVP